MGEEKGNSSLFAVFVLSLLTLALIPWTIYKTCGSGASEQVAQPWLVSYAECLRCHVLPSQPFKAQLELQCCQQAATGQLLVCAFRQQHCRQSRVPAYLGGCCAVAAHLLQQCWLLHLHLCIHLQAPHCSGRPASACCRTHLCTCTACHFVPSVQTPVPADRQLNQSQATPGLCVQGKKKQSLVHRLRMACTSSNLILISLWVVWGLLVVYTQYMGTDVTPFDPFAILQLSPGADSSDIKKAYR